MFEALDFVYVPTADVDAVATAYVAVYERVGPQADGDFAGRSDS